MDYQFLSQTMLFSGESPEEIKEMLSCLGAVTWGAGHPSGTALRSWPEWYRLHPPPACPKEPSDYNTIQRGVFLHRTKKKNRPHPAKGADGLENTGGQMTLCSIHRPRAKRTKKHSERNTQSRNMPIQMESRRPWKPSTIT